MIYTTLTVIVEFREQLLQLVWWRTPAPLPLLGVFTNLLKDTTLVSEQKSKNGRNAL